MTFYEEQQVCHIRKIYFFKLGSKLLASKPYICPTASLISNYKQQNKRSSTVLLSILYFSKSLFVAFVNLSKINLTNANMIFLILLILKYLKYILHT